MIKTRIASTAALFTFGLAALGGTVVAIAAPASADTGTTSSSSSQTSGDKVTPEEALPGTAGPADAEARQIPDELEGATRGPNAASVPAPGSAATAEHILFPHEAAPHSDHNGQGHKGSNNETQQHTPRATMSLPSTGEHEH
jgi:hypothetical protein